MYILLLSINSLCSDHIILLPLYIYSCTGSVAMLVDLDFHYSYCIVLNFGGANFGKLGELPLYRQI